MRAKSTLVSLSILLTVLLFGGVSGAVASAMITGKQIKNGTVTGVDIKNGSLTGVDLSAATKAGLRGRTGPKGATGASGISNWQMVHAASPSVPGSTDYQEISANCPAGTKLLSASARWHVMNLSQIALSYNPDGSGAYATSNNGSNQVTDNIDLTLICATVTS